MSQDKFDKIILAIQKNDNTKVAVIQAVRMTLRYPDLAQSWFNSLPEATLD
jgi:hypothetical protein